MTNSTYDKFTKIFNDIKNSIDYIEENLSGIENELIPHLKRVLHVQTFSASYANAVTLKIKENQFETIYTKPLCMAIINLSHLHFKRTLNKTLKIYDTLNKVLRHHPVRKIDVENFNEDLKDDLKLHDSPPSIEFSYKEIREFRENEELCIKLILITDGFQIRTNELEHLAFVMERYLKCLAIEMDIPQSQWDAELNPQLMNWI